MEDAKKLSTNGKDVNNVEAKDAGAIETSPPEDRVETITTTPKAADEKSEPVVSSDSVAQETAVVVEPVTPEKIEAEIQQIVEKLVMLMGIKSQARTKILEDGTYYVNLRTRHSDGLLIGRRGLTIISIQALANQIIKHRYRTMPIDIFVDVSGYRKKHENFLLKKALAVAKIVTETKRDMALDILTEKEFRMVENELAPLGTVRVHAIGTGSKKTVIIAPLNT